MGLFSKKSKVTTNPPKWARPYIEQGLQNTLQVFNDQQPRLNGMSQTAQDAFNTIAPGAFGTNPFIANAQNSAAAISSGALLGSNSGQATYDRLQRAAMPVKRSIGTGGMINPGLATNGDPSAAMLSDMAARYGGAGDARLESIASGSGSNPADRFASGVAGGQYLNHQPSADLYSGIMSDAYLQGNPYLDAMIKQSADDVQKQANQRFSAAGMGAGLSTAFGDVLSKNLADSENNLRYQNYNDAANRQLQAAGQSDNVWSGERGRMDASTGLLASNYNAAQDRALAAAQALSSGTRQDNQTNLAAAQALGGRYDANQNRALDAAKASDAAQSDQVSQILQSLGLTPALRDADYAGVSPALGLLNSAATIPWTGVTAYNGGVNGLTNGYSTTSTNPGMFDWIQMLGNTASNLGMGAKK